MKNPARRAARFSTSRTLTSEGDRAYNLGMAKLNLQEIQTFQKDSYLPLGQLFSAEEMSKVRESFDRVLAAPPPDMEIIREHEGGPVRSVMGWQQSDPVLDHFTRDSRVLDVVQSILGPEVVFHQTKYNPKAPTGKGEKWDPHRGITFWHYLDGVPDPAKMVSIFIAVTEQTPENGATFTWKGAHGVTLEDLRNETDFNHRQQGEVSGDTAAYLSLQIKQEKIAEYDRTYEKLHLTGPAGTVWLLDSRNLHASQPNNSDQVRILIANVYRSKDNHPLHPRPHQFLCCTSQDPLKSVSEPW